MDLISFHSQEISLASIRQNLILLMLGLQPSQNKGNEQGTVYTSYVVWKNARDRYYCVPRVKGRNYWAGYGEIAGLKPPVTQWREIQTGIYRDYYNYNSPSNNPSLYSQFSQIYLNWHTASIYSVRDSGVQKEQKYFSLTYKIFISAYRKTIFTCYIVYLNYLAHYLFH